MQGALWLCAFPKAYVHAQNPITSFGGALNNEASVTPSSRRYDMNSCFLVDVALLVPAAYTNNSASLCVRVVSGSALLKALLSLLCGGVRTRGCPRRTWHNV